MREALEEEPRDMVGEDADEGQTAPEVDLVGRAHARFRLGRPLLRGRDSTRRAWPERRAVACEPCARARTEASLRVEQPEFPDPRIVAGDELGADIAAIAQVGHQDAIGQGVGALLG